MPKKVSKRSPASKSKAQHPVRTVRKKRAANEGDSALKEPPKRKAAATQRLRELPIVDPFFLGGGSALSEKMRYQLALANELRTRASPEEKASRQKYLADLKAEEKRQLTQELERVVLQLSPGMRRFFDHRWSRRSPDDVERLREAKMLLKVQDYPTAPLIEMVVALLENDPEKRIEALRRLAGRFNAGRPRDGERWALAKQAWIDAHKRGRPHRAIADAMEVSGFSKSAVYERAKGENWRAEASR